MDCSVKQTGVMLLLLVLWCNGHFCIFVVDLALHDTTNRTFLLLLLLG